MHCWNDNRIEKPFSADESKLLPGFTVADSKGAKKIKMLEDSLVNLRSVIAEKQEQIWIIEQELNRLRDEPEIQTPIMDHVIAVGGRS